VEAAPIRQFAKTIRSRQRDVMCDVDLDAWGDLKTTPDRALDPHNLTPCRSTRSVAPERGANLVERAARGLQFLDLQQPIEMRLPVMRSAADPERSRNQPFLDVVADCPARHVGEIGEILNRITLFVGGHTLNIDSSLSHYNCHI
jgi:hypothetical protein